MKRAVLLGALAALAAAVWAVIAYEHGFAHFIGVDTQQSQNYDFVSGVGPMIITSVFSGGVIVSLWHGFNCHEDGCWRFGRHKIHGTPWCNVHQGNARPELTVNELLTRIETVLERIAADSKTANDAAAEMNRQILAELRQN